MNEWELYTINVTHEGDVDAKLDNERGEITDRFENELARLIKKYQGQAGLKFVATNSLDDLIREY